MEKEFSDTSGVVELRVFSLLLDDTKCTEERATYDAC